MKKYLNNFMRYRFLLKELVIKGIKLKYRRSYLGLVWTLLEPLLTTMVLAFVFGNMLGRKAAFYPVYILCGRLIYSCFSSTSKIAMRSIRANQAMIKKVYVPKYLYPLSSIIYNYILFLLSLIVLVVVALVMKVPFTWHVIEAFIPMTILFILCVAVGLILSTVCVFFRDLEYLWDVVIMLIMYCSAIFYYVDAIGAQAAAVLKFNPLYCIISNFRCVFIEQGSIFTSISYGFSNLSMMLYSLVFSLAALVAGIIMFMKNQDKFILHI
ncbi:ABC transporter permease [uncultured Eubacterium sp.]|uniref:ABC transporter permease n=1 Tax=uncultured Eubacterium sp. TaxID=165185 RepID=UPI00267310A9|nr:ABC transporter permease [uncultured Eubacterium sp.]